MKHATTTMKHDYGLLRVKGPKPKSPSQCLMYGKSRKSLRKMHIRELFAKKRISDEKN